MKFNHITINTGHVANLDTNSLYSFSEGGFYEILEKIYFHHLILDWFNEPGYHNIYRNYYIKTGMFFSEKLYLGEISKKVGDKYYPVVATFGVMDDDVSDLAWNKASELYADYYEDSIPLDMPKGPFVCDVILPNILAYDAYEWTGSLCSFIGLSLMARHTEWSW